MKWIVYRRYGENESQIIGQIETGDTTTYEEAWDIAAKKYAEKPYKVEKYSLHVAPLI